MTKPPPAITVAMSVYNGEAHLSTAIESILAQTFADFEFLILNDGSTDESKTIIEQYAVCDSRIRAIHRENRGLVASLNQLINEARAPLIARMDDDDIAMPERFERQKAFLDTNPEYGVVGAWSHDIDADGTPSASKFEDPPLTHEEILEGIDRGRSILCHPVVMMRRDVVIAAGGYHRAFTHCEDFDLWLRIIGTTKLANLPERLIQYRRSSSQISNRQALSQQIGAAISHFAYQERAAGRLDPTEALNVLPPLDELDALFGRPGIADELRAIVVPGILYSESALKGAGHALILDSLRRGQRSPGLWNTVARLLKMGEPRRAAQLAWALLRS